MFSNKNAEIGTRRQVRIIIDTWSLIWIITSFPMFVYVTTYVDYDPIVALKGVIGILLGLIGLALSSSDQLGVGFVLDPSISMGEFSKSVTTMVIAFGAIFATNIFVGTVSQFFGTLAIVPVGATVFSLLIGINEEPFRAWLHTLVLNMTGDDFAGVLVSSSIMAVIHLAIYATRGIQVLIVVFFSFFFMGWAFALSEEHKAGFQRSEAVPCRRISPIQNAHGLVNVTAGLRAAAIVIRLMGVFL